MNLRERFHAVMAYEPFDRVPVWYFGTWPETKRRWASEGLEDVGQAGSDMGPELPEMDADWEPGMWDCHDLAFPWPLSNEPEQILDEGDDYQVVRTNLGAVLRKRKGGASVPQHIKEALEPTREAWKRFKTFLDPHDPRRRPEGWEDKARALGQEPRVRTFTSSLYGLPREWLGVQEISLLAYDDPELLEEIVAYMADFYMTLYGPLLEKAQFDFAYIFEDCCFNTGPMISPHLYTAIFDKHYRRLIQISISIVP